MLKRMTMLVCDNCNTFMQSNGEVFVCLECQQPMKRVDFVRVGYDASLEDVAIPAMEWLSKRYNPHSALLITSTNAEVLTGEESFYTDAFIRD